MNFLRDFWYGFTHPGEVIREELLRLVAKTRKLGGEQRLLKTSSGVAAESIGTKPEKPRLRTCTDSFVMAQQKSG